MVHLDMAQLVSVAQTRLSTPFKPTIGGTGGTKNRYSPISDNPPSHAPIGIAGQIPPIPSIPPEKTHQAADEANSCPTLDTDEVSESFRLEQLRQLNQVIHAVCDAKGLSRVVRRMC